MQPACQRADAHHLGVVAEGLHQPGRGEKRAHGHQRHADLPQDQGEPKGLPQPGVFARPVVVARHRLEPLPDAQHHREYEHKNAPHNAHGGHRGVAPHGGLHVQQSGGKAGQRLAGKAGQAAGKDAPHVRQAAGEQPGREHQLAFAAQKH